MAESKARYNLEQYLQTSKNKTYFVAAVTFAFLLIILIGGVIPAFSSVINQYEENKKRDTVIDQLERKLSTLKSLTIQESEKKETIDTLQSVFANEMNQEDAIVEIDQYSKTHTLTLRNISFPELSSRRSTPASEYNVNASVVAQEMNFTVEGQRDSILNFIKDLESSKRIYNIVSVSFQIATDAQTGRPVSNSQFVASFKIEYFWRESQLQQ